MRKYTVLFILILSISLGFVALEGEHSIGPAIAVGIFLIYPVILTILNICSLFFKNGKGEDFFKSIKKQTYIAGMIFTIILVLMMNIEDGYRMMLIGGILILIAYGLLMFINKSNKYTRIKKYLPYINLVLSCTWILIVYFQFNIKNIAIDASIFGFLYLTLLAYNNAFFTIIDIYLKKNVLETNETNFSENKS